MSAAARIGQHVRRHWPPYLVGALGFLGDQGVPFASMAGVAVLGAAVAAYVDLRAGRDLASTEKDSRSSVPLSGTQT
jgi:hypothetical protein